MPTPVQVPKESLTMEEGTIVRWLKQEGEQVTKGEVLFELETDKVLVEVPSPISGILQRILVPQGTVAVGATVAFIGTPSDTAVPEGSAPHATRETFSRRSAVQESSATPIAERGPVRATPAARRLAKEFGVDLSRVKGTGPEARITQEDVQRVAAQTGGVIQPLDRTFRRAIAGRVSHAWRTVPHIHIAAELTVTGLKVALERARSTVGTEVGVTDMLLYVLALLLPRFPSLNSVWEGNQPVARPEIHLAFAVATGRGVVAPIVREADRRTLKELAAERTRLTEAARTSRLKVFEMEGGTFTLTNLGMFPVDFFLPIINYPQSAILASGRIREKVEIRNGVAVPSPHMWINLGLDHRVIDGAEAAEFLKELQEALNTLEQRII